MVVFEVVNMHSCAGIVDNIGEEGGKVRGNP